MAPDDNKVPYGSLNIGGQVVSTLHQRPHRTTHFNTIRAQHRAQTGTSTKLYITASRNHIHQMRDTGNIIPLDKGHMRLSPQARKATTLVLSNPELTNKQRAKCVNALAGVFTRRAITRDQSVLEVATAVTGSALPSQSSQASNSLPGGSNVSQDLVAGHQATPGSALQSPGPFQYLLVDEFDEFDEYMEEPPSPGTLPPGIPGPFHQPPARRTISRHGTEVFGGLVTPGYSPIETLGERSLSTVIEQDVEMDGAATGDYGLPSTPPRRFRSLVRQATEPDIKVSKEDKIAILERENAELREMKESALRKLSRNGKGTISNMETVVDRAIRERDELHAENQKLENRLKRCESRIDALREEIPFAEARIARAEADRRAETQKKIRWIWRVLTLTGSAPREFRKKDAEIDNLRKKLAGMHAELSKEQSRLQGLQGQLGEERGRRAGVEAELDHSRSAHAREIHQRDLAGQRLRNQLKQVVENLDSGAMSI